MRSVTLRIKMINDHICSNCLTGLEDLGISIKVLRCARMTFNCGHCLLRLDGETKICDEILKNPPITDDERLNVEIARSGNGILSAMVVNKNCPLSTLISESGCFLELAIPVAKDEIIFHLIGSDAESVKTFAFMAREMGYGVTILDVYEKIEWGGLTFRQERALRIAYDLGYYDIPSMITLDELANKMGCSKSTLNVVMRRGERKIICDHLTGSQNIS